MRNAMMMMMLCRLFRVINYKIYYSSLIRSSYGKNFIYIRFEFV